MLKAIALALGGILAVFLGIVALLPSDYKVTRSIEIAATPADHGGRPDAPTDV